MSKIESPFNIDEDAQFRFALVLESRSVEAHSLMDSGDNRKHIQIYLDNLMDGNEAFRLLLNSLIEEWKEKHK